MSTPVRAWLEERVPLRDVMDALRHKTVPHHRYSVWYYFGGMTLFLFAIQVGTGGLLLLYYRPSAAEAYESVQFIVTRVPFGWLVRSIHAWSANLMVACAVAHLFSVLFLHAYRRPREITWVSGVLLLLLTLGFGFTGYLLPWNEVSFFATRVGTDIAATVPAAGEFLVRFMRGGADVTGATLTRLFGFHVAILPAIATALVVLHLLLIQRHGMSVPPSVERQAAADPRAVRAIPFLPHFLLRDLFAWTLVLAILAALATFYPWELGVKADPFAPAPAGIRPEWYFLWAFQTLKYVPPDVAGLNGEFVAAAVMGAGALAALLLPFLAGGSPRARRWIVSIGIVVLVYLTLMTGLAFAQQPTATPPEAFRDDVHAVAGLTCASCHGGEPVNGRYPPVARTAIAPMCARCHSDPAFMRKFDPQVRTDQFAQYQTSTHGRRMAAGETRVATCSDCHFAHGTRQVTDARSSVAPTNVARTCGRCHGDPEHMKPFGRDASPPADWSQSVHARALVERGDLSAPTCNSCHGSHGATPPGVASVANVCAQCHVRQATLFRASPKQGIFEAIGQAECLVCHNNHRIESPADHWIGLEEGAVCTQCHDASGGGAAEIRQIRQQLDRLEASLTDAEAILTRAELAGMLVDDGRLALRDAREHQVQARVLIHAFATSPFDESAAQGLAAAGRARMAGDAAMRELDTRRRGLAVATLLVLAFLATLWVKIRRLPAPPQ